MDYLDFELELRSEEKGVYRIAVRSPAGEACEKMHLPFGEVELTDLLDDLQIALLQPQHRFRHLPSTSEGTIRDFGQMLFDTLMAGTIRICYELSRQQATSQGQKLRLKLRVLAPEQATIPWEFMYDPGKAEFVSLSISTPVVRYLDLPLPIRPLVVSPPLRILGVVASPKDMSPVDVDREKRWLTKAIEDLQMDGLVELAWLEGQTRRDLLRTMRRNTWHVFHFIGHGRFDQNEGQGFIALVDDQGKADLIPAELLARILADYESLRLAFLNTCEGAKGDAKDVFASTAATLVRRGIPAVLAMQYEISNRAAIELARTFYESLADGLPVDAAVTESRKTLSVMSGSALEWGIPVLYMRSPDGVLFQMQSREVRDRATSPDHKPGMHRTEMERVVRLPFEPEMILVPASEFLMGSNPDHDPTAWPNEQPQHALYLPNYYIARTPVSNSQYAAFVQSTDYPAPPHWKGKTSPRGRERHPVVSVSWYDALAYCRWLSEVTGKPFRLPTEAEWEKGARGDDARIYPWGSTWDPQRCNCYESGRRDSTPVEAYPQGMSPYGLLDMAGNVWEWTSSQLRDYPYDSTYRLTNADTDQMAHWVLRGGSNDLDWDTPRCALRNWSIPSLFFSIIGFRVAFAANEFSFDQ